MSISRILGDFVRVGIDQERIYSQVGIAKDIDLGRMTFTFVPSSGGPDIFDVKLKPVVSSDERGFIAIPKDQTNVIVTFLSPDVSFLSLAEEIERFIITCDEWSWNGGSLGGLININDLVSKINEIEDKVTDLSTNYNAHIHPTTAIGAPTGPTTSLSTGVLVNTTVSGIEDDKIKH